MDPELLPRLASQMNAWINGDSMNHLRAELRVHDKEGTCPPDNMLSKWSIQLATCLALTTGACPQIGALIVVGDLTTLQENQHVKSGKLYTIQLKKFNPYRTGTIIYNIIPLIMLIGI